MKKTRRDRAEPGGIVGVPPFNASAALADQNGVIDLVAVTNVMEPNALRFLTSSLTAMSCS